MATRLGLGRHTFAFAAVAVLLFFLTACPRRTAAPQPEAPAAQAAATVREEMPGAVATLVPDTERNPYRQYAPGLLVRTAYKSEQAGGLTVELWDMLVGPGKKSATASLPGGAVVQIRSGKGAVTVSGKTQDGKTGTSFPIPEGESFQVENGSAEEGLIMRVIVVHGVQATGAAR
jgi:quercetin dioxygenase-like cupin family protein